MEKSDRVLIIEDDQKIIDLLEIHIRDLGLQLDKAMDGVSGLEKALGNKYRLLILDVMLPGMDGIEVCKRLREQNKSIPVLMLTAKSEELDKVLGLEIGADDYITKPFSIREFIARVKVILRREAVELEKKEQAVEGTIIEMGQLKIDIDKHLVLLNERPIELTAKEFDLLVLFARNPGRTYNRERLLDLVWGCSYDGYEHTVNSHINRLRNKLEEDPSNPRYIKTLWGIGYRFENPAEGRDA